MRFTLGTRPNKNGNIYRCVIDTDKKTYFCGYGVGSYTDIHATKSEIQDFIKYNLQPAGFKGIKDN